MASVKSLFVTAVLLLATQTLAFAGEKEWYPMVCRSGPGMYAYYHNYTEGEGSMLRIKFKKASVGASQRDPGPGECAWLDRPISPDEPSLLWRHCKNQKISVLQIDPNGVHLTEVKGPLLNQWISWMMRPGQLFSFEAQRHKFRDEDYFLIK
jgi:hypothetical protein